MKSKPTIGYLWLIERAQGMTYQLGLNQTWRQSWGPVALISKAASIANLAEYITLADLLLCHNCLTQSNEQQDVGWQTGKYEEKIGEKKGSG